jgi:nucleotide-binding universal stress UspA family protein
MTIRIARILCPVDFSDGARRALDQAVALAQWYGSTITVQHVHRISTPAFAAAPVAMPAELMPITLTREERAQLIATLDEYIAGDRATGVPIATLIDEATDVPATIVSTAKALGADLITLGTHGRSGFSRLVLGSVTEKVLRTAACPVLSVPPLAVAATSRTPVSYPQIVCPVDFSSASARALDYGRSLAREAHARLTVLHVIELPPETSDPLHPELAAFRKARFEDARAQIARLLAETEDVERVAPLILAGTPYQEILRVALEQQAELIVMGVQGRGAIDRALFGSTTQHLVRQAACPVLTVREATP